MTVDVDYEARLAQCIAMDAEKTTLIQELINRVKSLEKDLTDVQRKLERESDMSEMYQQKHKDKEFELQKLSQCIAQLDYVSVLVDGDCMPFVDEHIRNGEQGGRNTARLLKSMITSNLKHNHPEIPAHVNISIRIFANLRGLSKTYRDAKILPGGSDLSAFVNGFNKEDALCDFVDAGDGKECADEKMKATFRMNIDSVHCKRIFFGGSADDGYARLLGPYIDSTRITLLKGPPFARELVELAACLPTLGFSEVFRQSKLQVQQPSFNITAPQTRVPERSTAVNYATAASSGMMQVPNDNRSTAANETRNLHNRIGRNAAGHRIDLPIECSNADVKLMKAQKLCNEFHVLGSCKYINCAFTHGKRVNGKSLDALRSVARLSSCPNGLTCRSPTCILGHSCPKEPCQKGERCFFPPKMHGIDKAVVSWD